MADIPKLEQNLADAQAASATADARAKAQRTHAEQGRATAESLAGVTDATKASEAATKASDEASATSDKAASAAEKAQNAADKAAKKAEDSGDSGDKTKAEEAQKEADEAKEAAADAKEAADKAKEEADEKEKEADKACEDSPACEIKCGEEQALPRGCARNILKAGPIPAANFTGGGGPGGDTPGGPSTPDDDTPPPAPTPDEPDDPPVDPPPPYEPNPPDPLPNGCLWYGVSDVWRAEIEEHGLMIESFANLQNIPETEENPTMPGKFVFASLAELARGEDFAILSQERYGGFAMILKLLVVDEPDLLSVVEDTNSELFEYLGELIKPEHIEIFEVGDELLIP